MKQYEGMLVRTFNRTLTVSEIDKQTLVQTASEGGRFNKPFPESKISVVPIAIDTALLQPVTRQIGSRNILTLGTLRYPPNAEGILWFANEVFPILCQRLPDVSLTIIGANPSRQIQRLASIYPGRVQVTGYVQDLKPYVECAGTMVVPVRAGSGMRVRILEAFAMGIPVVTTTIGLEGIEAVPGEDALIADTPEDFASAVVRMLTDQSLQAVLSANGRKLAEERYDWNNALRNLGEVYATVGKNSSE